MSLVGKFVTPRGKQDSSCPNQNTMENLQSPYGHSRSVVKHKCTNLLSSRNILVHNEAPWFAKMYKIKPTKFLCCCDQAGILQAFNTQLLHCPSTTEKSWLVIRFSMLRFARRFPSQDHAIDPSLRMWLCNKYSLSYDMMKALPLLNWK